MSRPFPVWWWWFTCFCLFAAFVAVAVSPVYAQTSQSTTTDGGFQRMINKIVRGTPGITNVPVSGGGVATSSSGPVSVTARGITVPVPTSVTVNFSKSAIVKGVARVGVRAIPWVGAALVVNDIADAVRDSGIRTCPPPDFFCKPGDGIIPTPYKAEVVFLHDGQSFATVAAVCAYRAKAANTDPQGRWTWSCTGAAETSPYEMNFQLSYPTSPADNGRKTTSNAVPRFTCKLGDNVNGDMCYPPTTAPGEKVEKASQDDIEQELLKAIERNPDLAVRLKRRLDAVTAANPNLEAPLDARAMPLTVSAPTVSAPPKVVSTETYPNPDGSTSTKTITEEVKIIPQVSSPSTVSNPNVTYPSTTTVVERVTNNTTNKTETKTVVINNPAPEMPEPEKIDLPTDYNREATQRSILDVLKELAAPITAEVTDGQAQTDAIKEQNDKAAQDVTGISEGSMGITSWFPSVPTAACVNPQVTTPITGDLVNVPICDAVDVFSRIVSGVLCFFCIVGCVAQVRAAQQA